MAISGSLAALIALVLGLLPAGEPEPGERRPVDFKLQDFRGAWHQLDEVKDRKLVVLAFLGTECPLAGVYAPRLGEMARAYEKKGVVFFGVDSNPQDAPSALARFAKDCDLPFPLLKDVGNELADRLSVERTPEVFVLDADRVVRYRGRVDNQFGLGVHRAGSHEPRVDRRTREPACRPGGCDQSNGAGRLQDRPCGQGHRRLQDHIQQSSARGSCEIVASRAIAKERSRRFRSIPTSRPPAGRA